MPRSVLLKKKFWTKVVLTTKTRVLFSIKVSKMCINKKMCENMILPGKTQITLLFLAR